VKEGLRLAGVAAVGAAALLANGGRYPDVELD
jgi:hypothetical protein